MDKIILIGGGGHCRSVIDIIEQEGKYKIAGIIDKPELLGEKILQYEIIGTDEDLTSLSKIYKFALITVGQIYSPDLRIKLFKLAKDAGFLIPYIISPRAYVSSHATLDEGSVIMHDAIVNTSAYVGKNCIINTKAIIEHEVVINNHCHISTAAVINGATEIEENTFVGSNATVRESTIVKANSVIKAGSIVK